MVLGRDLLYGSETVMVEFVGWLAKALSYFEVYEGCLDAG
jgi:hypothetical protein